MGLDFSVEVQVKETGKKAPNWNLEGDINGKMSLGDFFVFHKNALITIAGDVLTEEQEKGFPQNPRKRIDNKWDLDEGLVNPLGKIEYFAKQSFAELMLYTYDQIAKRSPIGETGLYRKSNYVFFRGAVVATSRSSLSAWLNSRKGKDFIAGDLVRFVNVMPYARKLEHLGVRSGGATRTRTVTKKDGKGRKKKGIAPNGAYFLASRVARSRYKASVNFLRFQFITGDRIQGAFARPGFRTTFVKDKRPYLYPSIVMDFSALGAF